MRTMIVAAAVASVLLGGRTAGAEQAPAAPDLGREIEALSQGPAGRVAAEALGRARQLARRADEAEARGDGRQARDLRAIARLELDLARDIARDALGELLERLVGLTILEPFEKGKP